MVNHMTQVNLLPKVSRALILYIQYPVKCYINPSTRVVMILMIRGLARLGDCCSSERALTVEYIPGVEQKGAD